MVGDGIRVVCVSLVILTATLEIEERLGLVEVLEGLNSAVAFPVDVVSSFYISNHVLNEAVPIEFDVLHLPGDLLLLLLFFIKVIDKEVFNDMHISLVGVGNAVIIDELCKNLDCALQGANIVDEALTVDV